MPIVVSTIEDAQDLYTCIRHAGQRVFPISPGYALKTKVRDFVKITSPSMTPSMHLAALAMCELIRISSPKRVRTCASSTFEELTPVLGDPNLVRHYLRSLTPQGERASVSNTRAAQSALMSPLGDLDLVLYPRFPLESTHP